MMLRTQPHRGEGHGKPNRETRSEKLPGDQRAGHGAERLPLPLKRPADVVDREVLFAQSDDYFTQSVFLWRRFGLLLRHHEERAARVLSELLGEHPEINGKLPGKASLFTPMLVQDFRIGHKRPDMCSS